MYKVIALTVFLILGLMLPSFTQNQPIENSVSDSVIFYQKIEQLKREKRGSYTESVIAVARSFAGTPYVGKTLEVNKEEQLVVNLQGLDCSTFVESTLAIASAVDQNEPNFTYFKQLLQRMRYRGGVIAGYASRLHYFTDWIYDNQQKGVIIDITKELGGEALTKEINFMSTHRGSYMQLANDSVLTEQISTFEKAISARTYYYIAKENVQAIESKLEPGMIVGITTNITGLDIAHVGFLVRVGDRIHLLHASSDAGKVVVSDKPLADYLAGNKRQTGIMVLSLPTD